MHKNTSALRITGLARKRRVRPSASPQRILKIAHDVAIMASEMDCVVVVLTPESELLVFAHEEKRAIANYPSEWLVGCYTRGLKPSDIADDLQARLSELPCQGEYIRPR